MNMLKLSSIFLLLVCAYALRDEEAIRSSKLLDESTNDEKTSTEMKLYEEGDDTDAEDEIINDEKAILDASDESRLQKRNPLVCAARRAACFIACRRFPFILGRACRGICNFALRFANRAVCFVACRSVPRILRGICYNVCRCLR